MPSDNPAAGPEENLRTPIRKILIADDKYENRYLLEALLGASGYQVVSVGNGQDALDTLKTGKIDAIISDILMPVVDGFQLCRKVKEDPELVHIPFIFYSAAYTELKDSEFGLSLGADEYVTKPIEPEDFLEILKGALERAEQGVKARLEKKLPDNLSYYSTYSEVLGRKLDKTVAESDQQRELARFHEEKYRTLFQTMAEGGVYQDENGTIIDANPSAERILGLTLEEMQGRTSTDPRWKPIHEDGSPLPGADHPAMVALRTGQKNSRIMGIYNPRDAGYHWIMVNAVPQFLPGEESPNQVYTTFEDITTEKEAQIRIRHLNRILVALRTVNFLITAETKGDLLLRKICSSLVEGGGYPGIWIVTESESERQVFQEILDPEIRESTFNTDINQGNMASWIDGGRIPDNRIISQSLHIIRADDHAALRDEGYGVMITRLSYEDIDYGMIGACIPDQYLHDPDEESLFLEISRDIGFALHHIHLLQKEETGRNALSASEKQYRELVQNVSDTIFTLDTGGGITYVSPAIREITGLDPAYYIGKQCIDFIHAEDRDMIRRWFRSVLLNHTIPVEFRIIHEQGRIQYLRVKGSPVHVHDEVTGITGILSDITAWKESEIIKAEHAKEVQTLLSLHLFTHESEKEILQFALQAALDGTRSELGFIAFIKDGGKLADILVRSPESMGWNSLKLLPNSEISPRSGLGSLCLTTKKPVLVNNYQLQPDSEKYPEGDIRLLRFLEVPILDTGEVKAIIVVANRRDPYSDAHALSINSLGNTLWEIIRRKRSDNELKTALTQISHNMEQLATLNDTIRNPLTIIALYTDAVEEKTQKGILQAVHEIDEMVNRLDQGWVQSEKVKNFLIKHYQFNETDFQ